LLKILTFSQGLYLDDKKGRKYATCCLLARLSLSNLFCLFFQGVDSLYRNREHKADCLAVGGQKKLLYVAN